MYFPLYCKRVRLKLFSYGDPVRTHCTVFHTKLILFVAVVVLAIYPAIFFSRGLNTKSLTIKIPQTIIWVIRAELTILATIPLLAIFMARGYGIS